MGIVSYSVMIMKGEISPSFSYHKVNLGIYVIEGNMIKVQWSLVTSRTVIYCCGNDINR